MTATLIHNGLLIDGNGGAPLEDGAVLIRDGKIGGVGRKGDLRLPDEALTMIDAGGGSILPGLIDTHVHLALEGVNLGKMLTSPFSLRTMSIPSANRIEPLPQLRSVHLTSPVRKSMQVRMPGLLHP